MEILPSTPDTQSEKPKEWSIGKGTLIQHGTSFEIRYGEMVAPVPPIVGKHLRFCARLQQRAHRHDTPKTTSLYRDINCHRTAIGPLMDYVHATHQKPETLTFANHVRAVGGGMRRYHERSTVTSADFDWWLQNRTKALPLSPDECLFITMDTRDTAEHHLSRNLRDTYGEETAFVGQFIRGRQTFSTLPRPFHSFFFFRSDCDAFLCFDKKGVDDAPFRIIPLATLIRENISQKYLHHDTMFFAAMPVNRVIAHLRDESYRPRL